MATTRTTSTRGARRRRAGLAGAIAALFLTTPALVLHLDASEPAAAQHEHEEYEEEGNASAAERRQEPDAIEAAFPLESYRPGATARLRVWTGVQGGASIRVFHIGRERMLTVGNKELQGAPVTPPRALPSLRSGQWIPIRIGDWPSGLYFAKLTAPGRVGFATFVVPPRRLGESRVAVVLPTRTWQAYNFRDDNGDGKGDTWYATRGHLQARLGRPFLNRGVPPHFRTYDLRFLHWLHDTGRHVDVLSQADLDATTGARLAAAYELLVFPGHHEYVTRGEYDAVEGFRNRGGNLIFLSANNFFWRIDLQGRTMTRVKKWRELGRPEASLLGVQYIGNDEGERRGPWLVKPAAAKSWIFEGVKLRNSNQFSDAGIEIDAIATSSPRGTRVLAAIPDLLGPGMTAHMTYYETPRGAKVFSAGAFTLAGSIRQPAVRRLLENLWARLVEEQAPANAVRALQSSNGRYGWPVKPFDRQHPVRGFFGDPRIGMTPKGMRSTFHFGIDVSAPDGTPVYATLTGRVALKSFRPETVAVAGDDGRTTFEYWHILPAVRDGQRVIAYQTVVGHIEAGWGHVHFSELRDGVYVNPLRPGALAPYIDRTTPVIRSLRAEHNDRGIPQQSLHGRLDLVVEAFDETPLAAPAPWTGRPVTPAVVSWRLLSGGGRVVVPARTAVDYRRSLPSDAAFARVYARWTRQNKPWSNGRYRFVIARDLDTHQLANGSYVLEVSARDCAGNATLERFPVRIANGV